MKDTFGGTIMIYILIFFLGIYIVFIALTLRYAQSFKLKNKTIELIEEATGEQNDNMINPETGIVPTTEPLDVNSANSGYILDSTVNTDREPEITNKPVDNPVIEGYNYSRTSVGALENLMPASKFGLQETYQPMNIAMRKYVKSKK